MESSEPVLQINRLVSQFCDQRDHGSTIDTVVIHSMFNPEGEDPYSAEACKACLDSHQLSAHYLLDRAGVAWQLVPEVLRAWHAGVSCMPAPDGREGVNHFSIGIEVISSYTGDYTDQQYVSLAALVKQIASRHPVRNICGHCHIAPGRKDDPWCFDWVRFRKELEGLGQACGDMRLPDEAFTGYPSVD